MISSQPFIWEVITAKIKHTRWTHVGTRLHIEYSMKINWQALLDTSSSCPTWQNLSSPSSIRWTRLNSDDLHPRIIIETLIEDEEANQTVTTKCSLFIPLFVNGKSILGCFKQSNFLDISILESLAFFLNRLIFAPKKCLQVRFHWENHENLPLKH